MKKGAEKKSSEKGNHGFESLSGKVGMLYRSKYDDKWTMRYLSEACKELTGYQPEELIDNKEVAWIELIEEEDRERVRKKVQEDLKEGDTFKVTYRIKTKSGDQRWMWEQGRVVKDEEGGVKVLEGFITDIDDMIGAKEEMEEREKKARELYSATTKMERCRRKSEVFEIALESAKEILGFYASSILTEKNGKLVVEAKTEKSAFEIGDSIPSDAGMVGKAFQNKESNLFRDVKKHEKAKATKEILRSGLDVPIGDRGMLLTASEEVNYYDEFDLEMAKILTSHINEALKRIESEKNISLIMDTTEEQIIYLDKDLKIEWANKSTAEYVESSREEIRGEICYELAKDRKEPCEECPVIRCMETGETEEMVEKINGEYYLLRATPDIDDHGNVRGAVEVVLDITERVKAKNRIKRNKEKIEKLLEATSEIEKENDPINIYRTAVDATENILGIKSGAIFVDEGDKLVLKAKSSGLPDDYDPSKEKRDKDRAMLGRVWKTKEPDITADLEDSEQAEPLLDGFKSGITVPIGDKAVFQAMAREKDYFDEDHLSMLDLLLSHVNEAVERAELTEELKLSEERYRRLFEKSPISIWEEDFTEVKKYVDRLKDSGIKDFDSYFDENPDELKKCTELLDINDVNEATLETYKADSKEKLMDNFDKIFKEDSLEGLKKEILAVVNQEMIFETDEMINYTLNGEKRYFYLKWVALRDDYSKVIVSLVDITELKRVQKELELSEERYRTIFQNTGTAMAIIEEDMTISMVNEEMEKISGYSKENIEGTMIWTELVPDEEEKEKMKEYHQKRREGDEDVPDRYSIRGVTRFGDERSFLVEASMIPETGKTVASLIDVTDFRKTFGALREAQESFRVLFDNNREPIILLDENMKIKEANDRFFKTFDLPLNSIENERLDELLHPDTSKKTVLQISETLSGEKDHFTSDVYLQIEEKYAAELDIHLIRDNVGEPLNAIAMISPKK